MYRKPRILAASAIRRYRHAPEARRIGDSLALPSSAAPESAVDARVARTFGTRSQCDPAAVGDAPSHEPTHWIDPTAGQTTIGEWAPEWLASKRRLKPNQSFNVLASMLDGASANSMIPRNVARGVELPRIPHSERRCLTEAQVMRLADAVPPIHRALILVLAYLGIR